MEAYIELKPGDRMRFSPGIGAKGGDDFAFRDFISQYDGQECVIVELPEVKARQVAADHGGAEGALFDIFMTMDNMHPRFKVRFKDGTEKKLKSIHLTALTFRPAVPPPKREDPPGERDPKGLSAYSASIDGPVMEIITKARKIAGLSG